MTRMGLMAMAVLACGCGSSELDVGFGVAMSLVFDSTVSDDALGKVKALSFSGSGDETFAQVLTLDHAANRTERAIYRPLVTTTTLAISVSARDAAVTGSPGVVFASGRTGNLTLVTATSTAATIILTGSTQTICATHADCDVAHVCNAASVCELPTTCRALKRAHDTAPDGRYSIVASGSSAPLDVYCDMTKDGGGWMLVTPDMIASESSTSLTEDQAADTNGGVILTLHPMAKGCSHGSPNPKHVVLLKDVIAWQQIRAHHVFAGAASCWSIFGDVVELGNLDPNVSKFDRAFDFIHDEVRMGGSDGDKFGDVTDRCDGDPKNFWEPLGGADRSATVGLRRKPNAAPAGLAARAECLAEGPTLWAYSDIYVREN